MLLRPLKLGAFLVFTKTFPGLGISSVPQPMNVPPEYLERVALGAGPTVYLDPLLWGCLIELLKADCNQVSPFPGTEPTEAIGYSVSSP